MHVVAACQCARRCFAFEGNSSGPCQYDHPLRLGLIFIWSGNMINFVIAVWLLIQHRQAARQLVRDGIRTPYEELARP